jgi:N-acetylglucosamine-6-sulfatase
MRYQTAPRPEGFSAAPWNRYLSASYAEAGDRDRTGDGSLEGSSVTNYTTPAPRPIIGSLPGRTGGLARSGLRNSQSAGRFYGQGRPPHLRLLSMQLLSRPRPTHARTLIAAAMALLTLGAGALAATQARGAMTGANVVFILTDDMTSSELAAMPNVQSLIAAQGTTFSEAYTSFPLCCPSRATMMSGQYMHNHGVRGNLPPNGSWFKFRPHESNDLPVWLQDDGYYNVHIGKYMNGYSIVDGTLPVPPGWNEWYGKVSEDALYFDYNLIEKTARSATPRITFYGDQPTDYQTDVFGDRAVDFVQDSAVSHEPFWLNLWFNSPHGPFDPAPRDRFRLAGTPLPRLPGFNEKDVSDKPKWLRRQIKRPLRKKQIRLIDEERRRQQEQLLSVDQSVGELIQTLQTKGILDDTYVIFASDNGFFRGEHRIASGKYLPYDPSARVPLLIRGPGIPRGGLSNELVWNGDIAQTIDQIASGSENPAVDGRSLLPFAENPALRSTRPVLLEGDTGPGGTGAESAHASAAMARAARVHVAGRRGVNNLEQEPDAIKSAANNTNTAPAFRSIRTDRYEYTVYANGQTELYDMKRDPAQLRSLATDRRYRYVRKWLFDHLAVLSTCAGAACRVDIGPDPLPLPKSAVRPKRR